MFRRRGRSVPNQQRPSLPGLVRAAVVATVIAVAFSGTMIALAASRPDPNAGLSAPTRAVPGSVVVVSGSGFRPGQTGNLTYNGGVVTTFTASSGGTFSVLFTIPSDASPAGSGRISAKHANGSLIATTTLSIVANAPPTAAPTDTPTAAPTDTPTAAPTDTPTGVATDPPIAGPTDTPLAVPSGTPTAGPSDTPLPTPLPTPVPTLVASGGIPAFSHVYVIVMENREYSSIVGSSAAPYINSLIARYGLATSYYATNHPSEPNYIALTSGGTQGVSDDGLYDLRVNNLFDQVAASGRTWHAYQQGYPGNCFTGSSASSVSDGAGLAGSYVRRHNPAISYTSISGNAANCANITNLAGFDPAAANLEFITPNLINDMHDGSLQDGDNFLKAFLPGITGSAAFANSVVFVTWDEGTSNANGGGHIATIAVTPGMTAGYQATGSYNHYSLLRTIEQAWGLPFLGAASSAAPLAFPY